jgi:hypothetical protein
MIWRLEGMIEFSVSFSGLKFEEVANKLSGDRSKEKLVDRLTDIAFAAAFWEAPVKTGYLASTVYKDKGCGWCSSFLCSGC